MKVNGQKGHEPLTHDDLVYKETQGHQVIIWTGQSVMIIMHIFDGIRSSWKTLHMLEIFIFKIEFFMFLYLKPIWNKIMFMTDHFYVHLKGKWGHIVHLRIRM